MTVWDVGCQINLVHVVQKNLQVKKQCGEIVLNFFITPSSFMRNTGLYKAYVLHYSAFIQRDII